MSAKIVQLPLIKPKTYTSQEALIDAVREQIFMCRRPYKDIAHDCGISSSTVSNLANGKTRWPRASTLFPLIHYLGFDLALTKRGR